MRHFLSSLSLVALPLFITACARETLAPEQLDGPATSEDASADGTVEPQIMPEGGTTPPDGQTCSDGDTDGDGVCNGQDNCPEVANPLQNASACSGQPPAGCANATLPGSTVRVDVFTIKNVKVGGVSNDQVIPAEPGAQLQLEVSANCIIGAGLFLPATVTAGFDGASTGQCQELGCPSFSINPNATGTVTLTITAPSTPGLHYIKAIPHQEIPSQCTVSLDEAKSIAAICVK